jgi:hypothetical protein
VNLTGESKNFKILEFPLNHLQTYYGYLCDLCPSTAFIFSDLNYKMVIFLSQTESNPKLFFLEKQHWLPPTLTLQSFEMSGTQVIKKFITLCTGPYLRKGQRGPGPGQQISRGGILKKIEIEVWYAGKKRLSTREKFKGNLY